MKKDNMLVEFEIDVDALRVCASATHRVHCILLRPWQPCWKSICGAYCLQGQRDAQFYTIEWTAIKHQNIANLRIASYCIIRARFLNPPRRFWRFLTRLQSCQTQKMDPFPRCTLAPTLVNGLAHTTFSLFNNSCQFRATNSTRSPPS